MKTKELVVVSLGATFSGTVIGYVKNVVPGGLGIGDEILTTAIGFILSKGYVIKNAIVKDFGTGMLIAGISQVVSNLVAGMGGTIGTIHSVNLAQKQVSDVKSSVAVSSYKATPLNRYPGE